MLPVSGDLTALSNVTDAPQRAQPYSIARRKWLPDVIARRVFGAPLAPNPREWARVLDALWHGDPAMDQLVEWMFASAPGERKALFERALMHGIASVDNAPEPLRHFFTIIESPPAWLDRGLLDRGARAAQQVGMAGFYVLRDMALMGGYIYFNSMNQTLAATGALHKDVALRLGETGKWLSDVVATGGLQRFGPGFITTVRVRMVHALVRRAVSSRADWQPERWGLPINQVDMLATYLAFGPVTLLGARLFGVPINQSESRAAMHMWRYIGWLTGVDDHWLATSETDGLRKLYHAFFTHRLPDDKVRKFGAALRDEPLSRYIPALENKPLRLWLARRYHYYKHIANSAPILGPVQRHRLGLPLLAVPWYLVLTAPLRFLILSWYRWRGGATLDRYIERSAAKQQSLLASYFKDGKARIMTESPSPLKPPHDNEHAPREQ